MNIIVDKNRPELESAIGGHIRLLVKDLCRKQVILDDECDDITEHSSSKDRADALLKLLDAKQNIKRNVFEKLYRSCLQCELWTAADILNPDQKPHKPVDEDDSDDELFPKEWLPAGGLDLSKLLVIKAETMENISRRTKYINKYKKSLRKKDYYPMVHKKRGHILVISNKTFEHMEYRKGTEKDEAAIQHVFTNLGFHVTIENDLTSEGMWKALEDFSKTDFRDHDCMLLFILTHGHKGVVFGTDGDCNEADRSNYLTIQSITDLFCSVKSLVEKPKLFFVQACQGHLYDKGHEVSQSGPDSGATPAGESEAGDKDDDHDLNYLTQVATDDPGGKKVPSRADVYVVRATVDDYVSFRYEDRGTLFVQAVVYVLARLAYKMEIRHLVQKVQQLVKTAEIRTKEGTFTQAVEDKGTISNRFYFFPGLHNETD